MLASWKQQFEQPVAHIHCYCWTQYVYMWFNICLSDDNVEDPSDNTDDEPTARFGHVEMMVLRDESWRSHGENTTEAI